MDQQPQTTSPPTRRWCAEPLSEHRGHGSAKRRAWSSTAGDSCS